MVRQWLAVSRLKILISHTNTTTCINYKSSLSKYMYTTNTMVSKMTSAVFIKIRYTSVTSIHATSKAAICIMQGGKLS